MGESKQISDIAIKARLRPHTTRAIEVLVEKMEARHPAVAMGAAKTILDKFVPNLKSTDLKHSLGDHRSILNELFSRLDANPKDSKSSVQ